MTTQNFRSSPWIARDDGCYLTDPHSHLAPFKGCQSRLQVLATQGHHDRECRIRPLSPLHLEKSVEFFELLIAPRAQLYSAPPLREGTRELLTITRGSARVIAGDNECQLGVGDSAHHHADQEHTIENDSEEELLAFLVVTYE